MNFIKKQKLAILLAIFLCILTIILIVFHIKNSSTNKYKFTCNSTHSVIVNKHSNEELKIIKLKRLYHLDSIYTHINNLYKTQCALYTKGISNEKIIMVLEIEKNS